MKKKGLEYTEEDEASIDSRVRNKELKIEFDELYINNCIKAGKKLTSIQNTALFVDGSLTRLLLPPRTHYSDCLRKVGQNMYVSIKKQEKK